MDIVTLIQRLDVENARAFVTAVRNVVDALLIEAQQLEQQQTPEKVDYRTAELPREAPAEGWLTTGELRNTVQKLSEAIAVEKWMDGVRFALQTLSKIGGGL